MDRIFDRMLNSITVEDIVVMFADIQRHTHPIFDRIDNYLMPIVESIEMRGYTTLSGGRMHTEGG